MDEHKHFTKSFKWALLLYVIVPLMVGVVVGLLRHRTDPNTALLWGLLAGLATFGAIGWITRIIGVVRIIATFLSVKGGWIGAGLGCCWWMATALLEGDTDIVFLILGYAFFGAIGAAIGFFADVTLSLGMRVGPLLGCMAHCTLVILYAPDDVDEPVAWVLALIPAAGMGLAIGGLLELGVRWLFDRSVQFYVPAKRIERLALALGGPLTQLNGESFLTLHSRYSGKVCRVLLADSWNIRDRSDANLILHWLMDEGQNNDYQGRCEEVSGLSETEFDEFQEGRSPKEQESYNWIRQQLQKTATTNIVAWDAGRLIQAVRWCHGSGYLMKKQAWEWIYRAARRVLSAYHSWDEYADHYTVGYEFWRLGDKENESRQDFIEALRWLRTNPESPWQDLEWRASFDTFGD